MSRMNSLTLASAQHLRTMGHITPAHHAQIKASVTTGPAAAKEMAGMERQAKRKKPRPFGSMIPQQAQAPIPEDPMGQGVPAGTATGYGDDEQ
jgi:hypothetical protein